MVKIGDKIRLENKNEVEVIDLVKANDGRYFIFYEHDKQMKVFLEGDILFKAVKR